MTKKLLVWIPCVVFGCAQDPLQVDQPVSAGRPEVEEVSSYKTPLADPAVVQGQELIHKSKPITNVDQNCAESDRIYEPSKPTSATVEIGVQKDLSGERAVHPFTRYRCRSK